MSCIMTDYHDHGGPFKGRARRFAECVFDLMTKVEGKNGHFVKIEVYDSDEDGKYDAHARIVRSGT